ncbi:MAG TPA: chloride channel protein [Syntrophales bacterium]|nr:chloride channel protein [Syntrophales bacterium]HQN76831.1 chloride channel protein [Syntrophales bacterium]HQQ26653.1 chloride channel protein [Syntrophales bacterium]
MMEKNDTPLSRPFRLNENAVMIIMAVGVGLLGGYGAVVFRWLIGFFQNLFFGSGPGTFLDHLLGLPWYCKLVPPIIGGAIVGPVVWFFAREAKGHGVPEVMEAVALRGGFIRKRVVVIKALVSAVCIASGGSVGREGPIVQIGSAIGSVFGQVLRVSADRMRTLVGCGAAAGIAATFNAPIAGVMFAMEIILGEFGIATFSPIVVSSVMATVVSRAYLGNFPAFVVPEYSLVSLYEIPLYILLGILAGFVGAGFTTCLYKAEDLFRAIPIPDYLKAAIGGLVMGVVGIFIPHVFGVGYDAIELAIRGNMAFVLLLSLIFLKIFATSVTIGSGGSGGVFAPSLFIGAMTGGAFGCIAHYLFPGVTATSGAYSLVGMGAVLAAATHGPINGIIILFEMTGSYRIILPLMLSCIIAAVLSGQIRRESIYTLKLIRRGVDIRAGREVNVLRSLFVRDAMTKDVVTVPEDLPLPDLVRFTLEGRHSSFPVVDREGLLSGIVTFQDFKEILFEEGLEKLVVAGDIAVPGVITVTEGENLDRALRKIGFRNIEQLPVVAEGNPRKIVGILSRRDILSAYNKALVDRSLAEGMEKRK